MGAILPAMLGATGLIAAVGHAQVGEPTPTPAPTPIGFNPEVIVQGLTGAFWITLLITVVTGAVGGIAYELLMLQGRIERPHKPSKGEAPEDLPYAILTYVYDLGIWARMIIGGLAAVAALLLLAPSTTFGLLAMAVVAGSAGTSIFRSLQDRLVASLAQKDAADTKTTSDKQGAKNDEALHAFAELKRKLLKASASAVGTETLSFTATGGVAVTLNQDDLDKVEQLLHEAKGIHDGLR